MAVIDADAHVIETEHTWEYMDEADLRPLVVVPKGGGAGPNTQGTGFQRAVQEYWVIGNRIFPKDAIVDDEVSAGARDMSNVRARLAHMDELSVDTHVLYPTLFLRPLTFRPDIEKALHKGYNRWMADIWKLGDGRLRWSVMVPLLTMDAAIEQMHYGKENGACGVFMHGVEHDKTLADPYFYPIYEEASKLDLPITIHATSGNFAMWDLFSREAGISQFKLPAIGAFSTLVMSRLPEKFPDLRWAFVEVSSQWVPYALNDAGLRKRRRQPEFVETQIMNEYRMYVACQTTDDLDWVLRYAGPDNIVIGTDYGHNDTSSEIQALRNLKAQGKVDAASVDKILYDNPKRLYGL